eukprot:TRINITY_DN70177_c0_g1_i1.p1 TRINITY_DN70177_c0_g1~~TRINITY_DN70177_c0_g1_i1.p1  ORF type:complete len:371 (-),score=25.63 TRINITY_DN70177_c0_g1_i1:45-1157(-)
MYRKGVNELLLESALLPLATFSVSAERACPDLQLTEHLLWEVAAFFCVQVEPPVPRIASITQISTAVAPSPRFGHTLVLSEPYAVVLFGGRGGQGCTGLNDVWKFSLTTMQWHCLSKPCVNPPAPRHGHGAAVLSNHLIVFGGGIDRKYWNDMAAFCLHRCIWKPVCTPTSRLPVGIPEARRGTTLVATPNGRLLLFGGSGKESYYSDMWQCEITGFDQEELTANWEIVFPHGTPPSARYYSAVAQRDEKLWLFGGSHENVQKNDLFEFDMSTYTWRQIHSANTSPSPRDGATLIAWGSELFLVGGFSSGGRFYADAHAFELRTNTWRQVETRGEFVGREVHAAALCGGLLIFGGASYFQKPLGDTLLFA